MFEVREYMLPAFSVNVDVPERVGITDITVPVRVSAKYAFDESVLEGTAIVEFIFRGKTIHQRTVDIESGSGVFSVDIVNDLKPTVNHGMYTVIDVNATFTDASTKQTIFGVSSFAIREYTYDVIFTGNEQFEKGKIYSCKLSLAKYDKTSVSDVLSI